MVWLPLVANLVVAATAPAIARRLPYRVKPVVLTGLAVIAAACWTWCLALLASSFLVRLPELAAWLGRPPSPRFLAASPPAAAGALAAAAVAGAAGMLLITVLRGSRDLLRAERLVRQQPAGRVLVLAERAPDACAVGGITGGRIVITAGMIDCLNDAERGVVLAHEQAHLDGRHHWLRTVVACCAAVDPVLRRFPALVEVACERWADERAVHCTEQRRVLARAIGKAALATLRMRGDDPPAGSGDAARDGSRGSPPPATTYALHHHAVTERMTALLMDRPRPARGPIAASITATAMLAAAMIGAAVHAGTDCFALLH